MILIVDDEPEIRRMVCDYVQRLGYRAETAAGADEALALASRRLDDTQVLVTDVVMPGMDGVELAIELRRRKPDMRVIVMSGYAGSAMARRKQQLSGMQFLAKPFRLHDLGMCLAAMHRPLAEAS